MDKEFKELFSNLSEKDQKEVANLIRFKNEVKYHDKQFEELLSQYIELSREHDKLQNRIDKVINLIKELACYEQDTDTYCRDIIYYDVQKIVEELEGKSE